MAAEKSVEKPLTVKGIKPKHIAPIIALFLVLFFIMLAFQFLFVDTGPGRCDKMLLGGSYKDRCYYNVANEEEDNSYCARIQDEDYRDECYSDVASLTGSSAKVCGLMSTDEKKNTCFTSLSISSNNTSYCYNCTSTEASDACFMAYAELKLNSSACLLISDQPTAVSCNNKVNSELAVKHRDPSYCRLIVSDSSELEDYYHDQCVYSLVFEYSDTSFCNNLLNQTLRSNCLSAVASPESCASEIDPNSRSICYFNLAVNEEDASYCERVDSSSLKDNCYYQIALVTGDGSLCGKIMAEGLKATCLQALGPG